mmetsp:Transcript_5115/g.7927  ORF Transcript_5115/g.7927 Transcript_5115/m.7927 type:complete len:274 (+) Transcript_5115:179-1000(+)
MWRQRIISPGATAHPPPLCTAHSSLCTLSTTVRWLPVTISSATVGSTTTNPSCSAKNPNVIATGRWCNARGTGSRTSAGCTVTRWVSGLTVASGRRNESSAAFAASEAAPTMFPHASRTCTSTLTCQTRRPANTHSDSTSTAPVSRMARSSTTASSDALSPGRPASKLGDAMGENSTLMVTVPSLLRAPVGGSSLALTTASTRVCPRLTSHTPSVGPKRYDTGRASKGPRPSTRSSFSRSAVKMNARSLALISRSSPFAILDVRRGLGRGVGT